MKLQLRYFASLREALGKSHETYETHARTVGEVRDELLGLGLAYACLARGQAVRLALNQVMVQDESMEISDNAELAFFPPVTGG